MISPEINRYSYRRLNCESNWLCFHSFPAQCSTLGRSYPVNLFFSKSVRRLKIAAVLILSFAQPSPLQTRAYLPVSNHHRVHCPWEPRPMHSISSWIKDKSKCHPEDHLLKTELLIDPAVHLFYRRTIDIECFPFVTRASYRREDSSIFRKRNTNLLGRSYTVPHHGTPHRNVQEES